MLLLPLLAMGSEPWLLTFPEISWDASRVYFSGPKWTAIYSAGAAAPVCMPSDTLTSRHLIPAPDILPTSVQWNSLMFRAEGNTLISTGPDGIDSVRTLPSPTVDAIACLGKSAAARALPVNLIETIGPITVRYNRIWFGLLLKDTVTKASVSGIGWFDPYWNRFSRVYSPALTGMRPEWIGARDSTAYLLLVHRISGELVGSTLVGLSVRNYVLSEVALSKENIPGTIILKAAQWGDTLLLATDEAVAYWKPRHKPQSWQSRAWAARATRFLYLKTFPGGDPLVSDSVAFLPLKSNTPTEVKAQVGQWMQVVAPFGIEGYVDAREWENHAVLWSQKNWSCRDSLCFARLRVPMHEKMIEVDFTNTPLTYLDRDGDGVKVGFRAAWAREEDLAPVMLAP